MKCLKDKDANAHVVICSTPTFTNQPHFWVWCLKILKKFAYKVPFALNAGKS